MKIKKISVIEYDGYVYNIHCTPDLKYLCENLLFNNCATGNMKVWTRLQPEEIVDQVNLVLSHNPGVFPSDSREFKINYTRMGEPFLNLEAVRTAIHMIDHKFPDARVHHYISTIGIQGSDFSWIKGNITLQVSLHSLDETRRNNLIPFSKKMSIEELGAIRTQSDQKTTVNLTLVDNADFDIGKLKTFFDPRYFFIKLSPINTNAFSESNRMGKGIIKVENLV